MNAISEMDTKKCVVFDLNDGSGRRKIWRCEQHQPIGNMPMPCMKGFVFVGWYTKPEFGKGSRFMEHDAVQRNMVLYAHWNKESLKHVHMFMQYNNDKARWTNDERNQTSLFLGSDGYDDYIEDLEESSPLQEDDEMHVKLEEHNAELVERLSEKASKGDATTEHRLAKRAEKQAMAAEVYADALQKARSTPGVEDDNAVKKMGDDNSLIYNDGVSPDTYEDTFDDLTLGG